jgi:leucyl aminopeptidase
MPPQVTATGARPDQVGSDALVIGATKDRDGVSLAEGGRIVDAALDGYLSEYLAAAGFRGKSGEVELVATGKRVPAQTIAVVGLGDAGSLDAASLRSAAGTVIRKLSERTAIASLLHESLEGPGAVTATVEGFLGGLYRFLPYKRDGKSAKVDTITLLAEGAEEEVERAQVVAQAVALARDLTNEPASTLTPAMLAARAREVADVAGLDCDVLDEEQLREAGFGGLLGVSQGSARPPRLIHLHYMPEDPKGKVALLGKGITFDSGGLSIKDAKSMETMKSDMAGAAAVIATMSALGRCGIRVEVDAYVPSCENMTGGQAIKPGDVIVHRGGRTTEVNNTDAEGRLVLSDVLVYACEREPDAIVDAATLTGGVMVALGRKATGLFSNDDGLARELEQAGESAGERIWRLPVYDDYMSELESEVADMKNSGGRFGSAIIGALFLKQFVRSGTPWAHLDIAGTARSESESGALSKGGTGVPVRTFVAWLEGRSS